MTVSTSTKIHVGTEPLKETAGVAAPSQDADRPITLMPSPGGGLSHRPVRPCRQVHPPSRPADRRAMRWSRTVSTPRASL